MIAYVDHPDGGFIRDVEGLREALRSPKLFLSLIVLREAPELLKEAAEAWAGVGAPSIAEAVYAYVYQYRLGLIGAGELLLRIAELFPDMGTADVLALQRTLKIGIGLTTCDLGAAVFVENPRAWAAEPPPPPEGVVAEAPRAKAYLVRNDGGRIVYDWDTMCVVPYSPQLDPALLHPLQLLRRAGYAIRTKGSPKCAFAEGGPADGAVVVPRPLAKALGLRPCF
ncbi:MAG: hypothetical protein JZD41_00480 [Thermoproteus sp.]|nr:hypothetical protein [Thermoproteus sp.]